MAVKLKVAAAPGINVKNNMDDFCHCDNPDIVQDVFHEQYGGEIVERKNGYYCANCGKDAPPVEPQHEE